MTNKGTKHLEDFLELSCGELKFYLQQRAISIGGTHSDLAARALVVLKNACVYHIQFTCHMHDIYIVTHIT